MTGRTSTARPGSRFLRAALPLAAVSLAVAACGSGGSAGGSGGSAGPIAIGFESVHGTLEDVPIKTFAAVPPWGTLPYGTWRQEFIADSVGQPHP